MKKTFACLLPFYNEGQRVLDVLQVVSKIKAFEQIVAVDDGSIDKIYQQIERIYPQVELVRSLKNQGKAEAVALGLKRIKTNYIFLCDADLENLQPAEIELALQKVTKPEVDMVILNRIKPNDKYHATSQFMTRTGIACLFSGDRVLQTADLKKIMFGRPRSYQLEAAINKYMIDHERRVGWIKSIAKNHYCYEDLGLVETFLKYLKMTISILRWTGPAGFIYQLFAWDLEEI